VRRVCLRVARITGSYDNLEEKWPGFGAVESQNKLIPHAARHLYLPVPVPVPANALFIALRSSIISCSRLELLYIFCSLMLAI
jgi:hypothetical protein